jgi:hypothetical protein
LNKKDVSLALLTMAILMSVAIFPIPIFADQGPKTEDLVINFRSDVQAAYADLKTGVCDLVGYEIQRLQYEDAINDPNVVLAGVGDYGMYEVDINSNCTIPTYPDRTSPTHYREVRQAAAFCVDKDTVIDTFCAGFAQRIDQPVAAPSPGWMNDSMRTCDTCAGYPYEYNTAAASTLLTDNGWTEGTTPNPYYDAAFPGSTQFMRVYPPGHENAGADVDPLVIYCRSDDLRRLETGRMLYRAFRKLGMPMDVHEVPSAVSYDPVMGDFDYHFYTGGWGLGRFPTYVYGLYHSIWYFPYGSNYVTGYNCTGGINYPKLDRLSEDLYYAATFGDAIAACKSAVGYFTEECITIPLWSSLSYWAYSAELMGVVNMVGAGPENGYSFMNAYKTDGSAIVESIIAAPTQMNVLYSSWYYDRQVEDRISLYGGMDTPPYLRVRDQGGFVQDWYVDTWDDGGTTKSKVTYWLRNDAYFVEPTTGAQQENVNMTSWLMSAFIQYALTDCWLSSAYNPDCHHFVVLDPYCVEVYYDDLSYWMTYDCGGAMLPPAVWLQNSGPLTEYVADEQHTMDTPGTVPLAIGPGIAYFDEVRYDATVLTEFVDYNWIQGELVISAAHTGGTVHVDYWRIVDCHGYWPGGVSWPATNRIIEGAGSHYLVGYTPGIGGSASMKRNPYYYMETPPEHSEIDFWWEWGPFDEDRRIDVNRCPRLGWYEVNLADMDYVRQAYDSQGTGIPDWNWFPGADLAEAGGHIESYDAASVVGNWKVKHSFTPDFGASNYP